MSPQRARLGLYMHVHPLNITGAEIAVFLRHLLQHPRGPVELLWDGGSIHWRDDVQAFLRRHVRLHVHRFPASAPELNPDEFVWTTPKPALASGAPEQIRHLHTQLRRAFRWVHGSQPLLWSWILASDLPWS